jgi:hypothetical protein
LRPPVRLGATVGLSEVRAGAVFTVRIDPLAHGVTEGPLLGCNDV